MAGQGAYIFGCEGTRLTGAEKTFFAKSQPWGFILFARNVNDPAQLSALTAEMRDAVGRDAPVLVDQEGGRVQRLRAPHWREFLPALDQMQSANDPMRAQWLRGRLIADDLNRVGIDMNCIPNLDLVRAETHPFLKNRCLGSEPDQVARAGRALADGSIAGGVLPIMKHMPGHGRSALDSHHELPRVDTNAATLTAQDFAPFAALSDLPMAMTAHQVFAAYDPDRPATQSPEMVRVMREEIGFGGLLMTDDISMNALGGDVATRGRASLDAGCDLVLHCNGEMDQMAAVADLGRMTPAAQARADAALAQRRASDDTDIAAAAAELDALLAVA
ncbi:MAG: beta-hexosaminidase [Rhodobacteraceae bacterium]|nr:beta-hexosaminidase [Paracoccaceae bacterium]